MKNKYSRILLSFVFFTVLYIHLPAQEILFQTSFYFEDGVGNKDTIVFGYEDVDTFRIDYSQGERPITTPWDSVFEVRMVHQEQYWNDYLWDVVRNSRNIEPYTGDYVDTMIVFSREFENGSNCRGPFDNYFFFHCLNYPITISWDTKAFRQDRCHYGSLIKAHDLEALLDARWWEDADSVTYACLASDKSLVLEKTPDNYSPWDLYFQLYDDIDQDDELDTLWGFQIQLSYYIHPDDWPCRYFVDNEELELVQHENTLELRQETVYINAVEESSLLIYDYSGRLRFIREVTQGKHEISQNTLGLPPGLYIAQLRAETGKGTISKKMVVY